MTSQQQRFEVFINNRKNWVFTFQEEKRGLGIDSSQWKVMEFRKAKYRREDQSQKVENKMQLKQFRLLAADCFLIHLRLLRQNWFRTLGLGSSSNGWKIYVKGLHAIDRGEGLGLDREHSPMGGSIADLFLHSSKNAVLLISSLTGLYLLAQLNRN